MQKEKIEIEERRKIAMEKENSNGEREIRNGRTNRYRKKLLFQEKKKRKMKDSFN